VIANAIARAMARPNANCVMTTTAKTKTAMTKTILATIRTTAMSTRMMVMTMFQGISNMW
jgi:carbohydrate-binding DOMON domain-containing protein